MYGKKNMSEYSIFLKIIKLKFYYCVLCYFRHNESVDEMSDSEISTLSKIDSIKEDFAKVLTDWQEHIGYLQVLLILWFVKFAIFNE